MRYDNRMGDVAPNLFGGGFFPNEGAKAQALAMAPQMTDGQAGDLLEVVDATNLGSRTKWMRYGLGAAVGIVVGAVVASRMGKKKK